MKNLKFTTTHEWLKPETGTVTIGITEHAQQLLGDMVFVELPAVGEIVHAGQELGVVESVKAASDFYSPISGEITAINEAILENPALVNTDPYQAGWLVKLKPSHPQEIDQLLNEDQYQNEIAEEH